MGIYYNGKILLQCACPTLMPPLSEVRQLAQTPEELRARFADPEVVLRTDRIEVIAGRGNIELSRKIAFLLGKELGEPIEVFADGEKKLNKVGGNLRKKGVFIIQSMHPSPDERLLEYFLMIDAARRASAEDIAGVLLYPAYMRQDKKDQSRVPISATIPPRVAEFLGLSRILSMELHSDAQQGFFSGPWDIVPSSFVTAPVIKARNLPNPIIASTDAGGLARARAYSRILGLGDKVVEAVKERPSKELNQSIAHGFDGDVEGKDVVMVEDIIDTGGTIIHAAEMFRQGGARSIRVIAPYGVLSTDLNGISATDKILKSPIDEVILTNAIEIKSGTVESGRFTYIDIAPMIAEAMLCVHTGESISQRLILDPPNS